LDKDQAVPGLKHLIGPAIEYMVHPTEKLHSILTIPSLYFTPATLPELLESIKKAPIKLYIDNNRFHFIPKELHQYLHSQYQHFWGSIYLYAPKIEAGQHLIRIKFAGEYRVKATTTIMLNDKKILPNATIHLLARDYISDARSDYRLKLIPPNVKNDLDPRYKKNHWELLLSTI
jgi:hypothetical protein